MNTASASATLHTRTTPGLQRSLLTHHALWWSVGLGVLARALVLLFFGPWDPSVEATIVLRNDASGYDQLARCLLETGGFCDNTNRTPGYPAFIASIYSVAGYRPWVVLAVQVVVDALTIGLTYALGVRWFTPRVAAVAALLLAFDPTSLFMSSSLLTDGVFSFLFLASMALFLRGMASGGCAWAVAAGALLGLAAWVRPSAQYLPLLLLVATLCRAGWPWRRRMAFAATLVLVFMLSISPWLERNHQQFGVRGLATVKGETLLNWHVAYFLAWRDGKPVDAVRAALAEEVRRAGWVDGGNPFDNSAAQERVALQYIRAQPLAYAGAMLRGMVFMYANVGSATNAEKLHVGAARGAGSRVRDESSLQAMVGRALREKGAAQLALGAVLSAVNLVQYLLALAGAWIALRDPRYRGLAVFMLVLVGYFTATSGISAEARYKLPATPLYLLLAGVAVQAWAQKRRHAGGR